VPGQALAQVGLEVGGAGLLDARHRQVLDQDVRCEHDRTGELVNEACGIEQRDRPPSLWPKSQGGSRCTSMASASSSAGSTSCAWRCRKSTSQASSAARGSSGRSPAASRRGHGIRRPGTAAAESPSTSRASQGLRAGTRAAVPRHARARSTGARCARGARPTRSRRSRRSRAEGELGDRTQGVGQDAAAPASRSRSLKRWILRWPSWAGRSRTRCSAVL